MNVLRFKIVKIATVAALGGMLLFCNMAFVRPIVVNLEELPKVSRWNALPAADQKKALKTTQEPMAKAGISQALEDWEGCVASARRVSAKSPLKDWALLLEISCAQSMADNDENLKTKGTKSAGILLAEAIAKVESHAFDPYSRSIQDRKIQAVLSGRLSLCRWLDKYSRWKELRTELQKAFKQENFYSKNDRALLYYDAGDLLVAERSWAEAFWQFQRAHDLNPSAVELDDRVRAIMPMVPKNIREQFEESFKTPTENPAPALNPSAEELEMANHAEEFLLGADPASSADALSKLIKKFPGGVRAKWAQEKMLDLLNGEMDKSKGPEGPSVAKTKILSIMLDFDSDRQDEWGKALFDAQNYGDAELLFKKAADQTAGSARASKAYYLAARSAQLGGDNVSAKALFQKVVKDYPAAPEVVDAAIQWGLININENDPAEAITHLETARSRKMSNQQDLISLFWLYEAYKMRGATGNRDDAANDLQRRFGLTYYGIIAYQDTQGHLPDFEKLKVKEGKVYFSDAESHALERARMLLAAGFLEAAAEELSVFSNRPLAPTEEQYLANFYAQALHYQRAFSLINSLVDGAPDKRTDFIVHQIFPKEYFDLVNKEKSPGTDLDPFLVLSVMKQESAFDRLAVSRSGAVGLLQMIPPTAQEVKQELGATNVEVPRGLFDATTNIRFCTHYLSGLLKKYNGSIPLALAAYNAGPTRITQFINSRSTPLRDTWVDELPWSETSFYVKSILKNYILYRMLYGGLTQLPTPPWKTN